MSEAARFYETATSGLGHDFLDDIQYVIDAVCVQPALGARIGHGFRRALVRRFPFSIVYAVEPDQIVVVAVAHQRRSPNYWKDR